jgi:hypothetical protein
VPREGGQQGWVVRRSGRRSFARKLCACTARARSKAAERWAAGFPSLAQYMREHKTSAEHACINTRARLIADLGDETARAAQRAASATSFDLRAITTSSSRSSLSLTNTRRGAPVRSPRHGGVGPVVRGLPRTGLTRGLPIRGRRHLDDPASGGRISEPHAARPVSVRLRHPLRLGLIRFQSVGFTRCCWAPASPCGVAGRSRDSACCGRGPVG